MLATLLCLLYNHDNLILRSHQRKSNYLNEGWLFIGRFKMRSVPRMKNKEALTLLYIKLHNELKSYLPRKISKFISVYILKKRWVKGQMLLVNCKYFEKCRLVELIYKYAMFVFLICLFKCSLTCIA